MKIKLNYFVLPLITVIAAVAGSLITAGNMDWYRTLNLPTIAPAGQVIGTVWTIIFILATLSILIIWNKQPRPKDFTVIIWLFLANALLNVYWSALFFGQHLLAGALIEMLFLNLTNLFLIIMLWPKSKTASILLWPYLLWVSFATYLAYLIWRIN